MRLRPEEVELVVQKILKEWTAQSLGTFPKGEGVAKSAMISHFTTELRVEDNINEETERVLAQYEKQFEDGTLDRRKMFQMVKNQLIKEKKVVI
jgi:hypothetical protein